MTDAERGGGQAPALHAGETVDTAGDRPPLYTPGKQWHSGGQAPALRAAGETVDTAGDRPPPYTPGKR